MISSRVRPGDCPAAGWTRPDLVAVSRRLSGGARSPSPPGSGRVQRRERPLPALAAELSGSHGTVGRPRSGTGRGRAAASVPPAALGAARTGIFGLTDRRPLSTVIEGVSGARRGRMWPPEVSPREHRARPGPRGANAATTPAVLHVSVLYRHHAVNRRCARRWAPAPTARRVGLRPRQLLLGAGQINRQVLDLLTERSALPLTRSLVTRPRTSPGPPCRGTPGAGAARVLARGELVLAAARLNLAGQTQPRGLQTDGLDHELAG